MRHRWVQDKQTGYWKCASCEASMATSGGCDPNDWQHNNDCDARFIARKAIREAVALGLRERGVTDAGVWVEYNKAGTFQITAKVTHNVDASISEVAVMSGEPLERMRLAAHVGETMAAKLRQFAIEWSGDEMALAARDLCAALRRYVMDDRANIPMASRDPEKAIADNDRLVQAQRALAKAGVETW